MTTSISVPPTLYSVAVVPEMAVLKAPATAAVVMPYWEALLLSMVTWASGTVSPVEPSTSEMPGTSESILIRSFSTSTRVGES